MMGTIIQLTGKQKRAAASGVFLTFLCACMEALIPCIVAALMNRRTISGKGAWILLTMVGTALLAGCKAGKDMAAVSCGFAADLRSALYRNMQELSAERMEFFTTAGLLNRLTADVSGVQNGVQAILTTFWRSVCMLICTLPIVLWISPLSGGLFLGAIPVSYAAAVLIIRKALPFFIKGLSVYDGLNRLVRENIEAVRIVKAFVKEREETEKFTEGSRRMYEYFVRAEKMMALSDPIMIFLMDSCLLAAVWMGSQAFSRASMSGGTLILLLTCAANLLAALLSAFGAAFGAAMTLPSFIRIAEVLEERKIHASATDAADMEERLDSGISISCADVCFDCKGKRILTDIEIQIPAHTSVGIIGPSGSGKTVLVQLLAGLYCAAEGEIQMNGIISIAIQRIF